MDKKIFSNQMQPGRPMQAQVNIDVAQLPTYVCNECQGEQWVPVFVIKGISSILSPNGKAGFIHHQTGFMCTNCGHAEPTQAIVDACKAQFDKPAGLEVVGGGKKE
jgi:hypothetical protein